MGWGEGGGMLVSKRANKRIRLVKGGGVQGLKNTTQNKTFGRFCLPDNYILPAGFCKTTSFVAQLQFKRIRVGII